MNDTELDEMLNQWKAPEPGHELRARVRGMQLPKRRFAWPSWEYSKGLIFGLAAGAAMFLFVVAIALPQSFTSGSVPFTVDSEFLEHKPDGSSVVREYRTEYLRDGIPTVLSTTLPGEPLMTFHNRIFHSIQNLLYPLMREVHGPNKRAITPGVIANDCMWPSATANGPKVIGNDTIFGYKTVIIRLPGIDTVRNTEWRAPALGCFELRGTGELIMPDGSFRLVAEKRATKITINRPQ